MAPISHYAKLGFLVARFAIYYDLESDMLSHRIKRLLAAITLAFGAASASATTIGTDFTITIVDDKTLIISAVDGGAALGSSTPDGSAGILFFDVGVDKDVGDVTLSDNNLSSGNLSLSRIAYDSRSIIGEPLTLRFPQNLGQNSLISGSVTATFANAHGLAFNTGGAHLNQFDVFWGLKTSPSFGAGPTVGKVSIVNAQSTVSAVPLPAAAPLLLSGLGFAAYGARRRRKAAQ